MTNNKRVLFVDDDATLRASLAEQWAEDGIHETVEAPSYAAGYKKGLDGLYEFMVLDASLPDGDGRVLCRALRDSGVTCPIVLLSASDSDADIISGLEAGANDYVSKPFSYSVLMARLDTHLRIHRSSEVAVYRIGPYTFRPSAKTLREGNMRIRLTERETHVLKFLQRAGRAVERQVLLREVWGYNPAASTHTLETHIYRLRQKIEKDVSHCRLLLTEGSGYRLNA